MKKTRAVAAFLSVATAVAFNSCGRIDDVQTEINTAEKLSASPIEETYKEFEVVDESVPYKMFLEPEEITKGDKIAMETLSAKFGCELSHKDELIHMQGLEEWAVKVDGEEKITQIFLVKDFDSKKANDIIVFLYEDDSKAAVAIAKPYDFVERNGIDTMWKSVAETSGVLSYYSEEDKTSYCIVPEEEGFLTSVWVVNTEEGTATDIYTNWNSPIWCRDEWLPILEETTEEASEETTDAAVEETTEDTSEEAIDESFEEAEAETTETVSIPVETTSITIEN